MDTFTEVTRRSWGGRIGDSIKGIVVGIVFCLVAPALLWWNEGRAVRTARSLDEGANSVVAVGASTVEPGNEGRLVHVSGEATTDEVLSDEAFGVAVRAIALRREVEMYQWREEKETRKERKLGGSEETVTRYRYEKSWSSQAIDSTSFREAQGHANPGRFPVEPESSHAAAVRLGAFSLPPALISKISAFEPLPVDQGSLRRAGNRPVGRDGQGRVYLGGDPARPQIGDVRVAFSVVRPTTVSVVARQAGSSFGPYRTRSGRDLEMLEIGDVPAEAMFSRAKTRNTMLTWVLRVLGYVLLLIGISAVARPLAVLGDVLPILGSALRFGIGVVAALLAAGIAFVVIALAWLAYRPILGVTLLAAAAAVLIVLRMLGRRKPAVQPPPLPPPLPSP